LGVGHGGDDPTPEKKTYVQKTSEIPQTGRHLMREAKARKGRHGCMDILTYIFLLFAFSTDI
jgi:hypothetical protein